MHCLHHHHHHHYDSSAPSKSSPLVFWLSYSSTHSGDRHVPTVHPLEWRKSGSPGRKLNFTFVTLVTAQCHFICLTVSVTFLIFSHICSVSVIQVEALLGYFETAVQYNKPNRWHNRFNKSYHHISSHISIFLQLNRHTVHTTDGQDFWERIGPVGGH